MKRGGYIVLFLAAGAMSSAGAQEGLDQTFMRRYNLGAMQGPGITTSGWRIRPPASTKTTAVPAGVTSLSTRSMPAETGIGSNSTERGVGRGQRIEPTADGGYVIGGSTAIEMGVDGSATPSSTTRGLPCTSTQRAASSGTTVLRGLRVFDVQPMASGFVAIGEAGNRPVLLRLDAAGQVLWAKRYPALSSNPLAITPLESGGFVFVSNHIERTGREACLDAQGNPLGEGLGRGLLKMSTSLGGATVWWMGLEAASWSSHQRAGGIGGEDILLLDLDPPTAASIGRGRWAALVTTSAEIWPAQGGLALLGSSDGFGASALDAPMRSPGPRRTGHPAGEAQQCGVCGVGADLRWRRAGQGRRRALR